MRSLVIAVVLLFAVAALFNCRGAQANLPPQPEPIPTSTPVVAATGEEEVVKPSVKHSHLYIPLLTGE